MKNLHILLLGFLLLLGITATAQFRKALPNNRLNGQIRDARLNIGLVGGTNFTTWFHFNNEESFPNGYQQYVHKEYNLKAKYQSVEAYAPLTYYINLSANKNIKPYF